MHTTLARNFQMCAQHCGHTEYTVVDELKAYSITYDRCLTAGKEAITRGKFKNPLRSSSSSTTASKVRRTS